MGGCLKVAFSMLNVNGQRNGMGVAGQKRQQGYRRRGEKHLEQSENKKPLGAGRIEGERGRG